MPVSNNAELRVLVTTALGAYPLENASVLVSTAPNALGERTLLYAVSTDQGGMTPPLELSTPPRTNSLTPDGGQAFTRYTVEVNLQGYSSVAALEITMFPNISTVLPVSLTPLPENTIISTETILTATGDTQALVPPDSQKEGNNHA